MVLSEKHRMILIDEIPSYKLGYFIIRVYYCIMFTGLFISKSTIYSILKKSCH